ncbi:hypothetical protein AYO44_01530 [Planctomycetaceae bacterium SCGC AG-212-F19]|nr:hypothetical protein AYO44_01530 [Planctomycetaceae bacterium SCGC AG-212-F19]
MPQFELTRHEAEAGCLPPVCVRCGQPAVCLREKQFEKGGKVQSWLLAPLCGSHKWHWSGRSALIRLAGVGYIVAICAGLFTLINERTTLTPILMLVGFFLWGGLALWLHYTSIRATVITDTHLTLTGVAEPFAEAVRQHRKSATRDVPLALAGSDRMRRPIRLTRAELQAPLPPVCMVCGEPATDCKESSLSGAPGVWGILLFVFRLAGALGGHHLDTDDGEELSIRAPFCQWHRNYWLWRHYLVPLGLPVLILFFVLGSTFNVRIDPVVSTFGMFFAFLGWLLAALRVYRTGIRSRGVTMQSRAVPKSAAGGLIQSMEVTQPVVTLVGVSHRFCVAMDRQRQTAPAV